MRVTLTLIGETTPNDYDIQFDATNKKLTIERRWGGLLYETTHIDITKNTVTTASQELPGLRSGNL